MLGPNSVALRNQIPEIDAYLHEKGWTPTELFMEIAKKIDLLTETVGMADIPNVNFSLDGGRLTLKMLPEGEPTHLLAKAFWRALNTEDFSAEVRCFSIAFGSVGQVLRMQGVMPIPPCLNELSLDPIIFVVTADGQKVPITIPGVLFYMRGNGMPHSPLPSEIHLPPTISTADVNRFLSYFPDQLHLGPGLQIFPPNLSLPNLLKLLEVSTLFFDEKFMTLVGLLQGPSAESLHTFIPYIGQMSPKLASYIFSTILQQYLSERTAMPVLQALQELEAIPELQLFRDKISSISLNFLPQESEEIAMATLTKAEELFPNVEKLYIKGLNCTVLPPVWQDTLTSLAVDGSSVRQLTFLPKLELLNISHAPYLEDLYSFNQSNIRHLGIQETAVRDLPKCTNLESASITSNKNLETVRDIDHSHRLRSLVLRANPKLRSTPSDCPKVVSLLAENNHRMFRQDALGSTRILLPKDFVNDTTASDASDNEEGF